MAWACGLRESESSEDDSSTDTEGSTIAGNVGQGHTSAPSAQTRAPQLRRRVAAHKIETYQVTVSTVTRFVNAIGVGRYQWTIVVGVGTSLLAESIDMSSVGPLHAALGRQFDLSTHERSMLTGFTYLGAGFAVLFAGPLTDFFGRKLVTIASVVVISISFLLLAVLPLGANFGVLLLLRSLAGSAAGVGGMAGTVLAIESCPTEARSRIMFMVYFVASCGYLLGAWILEKVMPGFGEEPSDDWRLFTVFMGIVPLLSLPFLLCIHESPLFLAVRGNLRGAIDVLQRIAVINGAEIPEHMELPERDPRQGSPLMKQFLDRMAAVSKILAANTKFIVLLSLIDGARSFMTGGSSYLWKDLFHKTGDIGPHLNLLASLSPLIGLVLVYFWNDIFRVGTRWIALVCSIIASFGLCMLTMERVQEAMIPLLSNIMLVKLTYGPLVTAVNLMKAEVFPTEVRATAYSLISVVAKLACMVAPSLIEEMRGDEWSSRNLATYLLLLAGNSLICGVLSLLVPDQRVTTDDDEMRQGLNSGSPHFQAFETDETGRHFQTDDMGKRLSVDVANIWSDSEPSEKE